MDKWPRHLPQTLFVTCPQSHIVVTVSSRRELLSHSQLKELPVSNANAHFLHRSRPAARQSLKDTGKQRMKQATRGEGTKTGSVVG